jgi:hypothetical protein
MGPDDQVQEPIDLSKAQAPAAPAQEQLPPAPPPQMTMLVQQGTDSPQWINNDDLARAASRPRGAGGLGVKVNGFSEDGSRMNVETPGLPDPQTGAETVKRWDLHVQDAAKKLGYDVKEVHPPGAIADPNFIDNHATGVLGETPAPGKYVYNRVKNTTGDDDPKIAGVAPNFYHYEPDTKQWYQVTTDTKDPAYTGTTDKLISAAKMAGEGIPAAIGAGTLGGLGMFSPVPGGALMGAAAGGAAGGLLGGEATSGLVKGVISADDPAFKKSLEGNIGSLGEMMAEESGKSMASGAIAGPAGEALQAGAGLVGSGLSGAGKLMKGIGNKIAYGGAGGEGLSGVAADFLPYAGNAKMAADMAQAPEAAMKVAPKVTQWLADTPLAKFFLSEEQRAALSGAAQGNTASEIGRSLDEMGVNRAMGRLQSSEESALSSGNASRLPLTPEGRDAAQAVDQVMSGEDPGRIAQVKNSVLSKMEGEIPGNEEAWSGVRASMIGPKEGPGIGEQIGQAAETAGEVGRNVSNAIKRPVRAAGAVGSNLGGAIQNIGETTVPALTAAARASVVPGMADRVRDYLVNKIKDEVQQRMMVPSR